MTPSNADGQQDCPLNYQALRLEDVEALRLEDMARLLSAAGPKPVTVDMLRADIAAGAPTNPDGTMNLLHYVAWLLKEMGPDDSPGRLRC